MNGGEPRLLVCIGLGGICEGWMKHALDWHQMGTVPYSLVLLIDGKTFTEEKKTRQHFHEARDKAQERTEMWQHMYPNIPIRHVCEYIGPSNVRMYIPDGAIVLASPDNHATRKALSDYAETVQNILLISGGNDGIDAVAGLDGSEGTVIVHCKHDGTNITPPITKHHPEITNAQDRLPGDMSCEELALAGQPQLFATNVLVGFWMAFHLWRYCTLPHQKASTIVETWCNSITGNVVHYGLEERPL